MCATARSRVNDEETTSDFFFFFFSGGWGKTKLDLSTLLRNTSESASRNQDDLEVLNSDKEAVQSREQGLVSTNKPFFFFFAWFSLRTYGHVIFHPGGSFFLFFSRSLVGRGVLSSQIEENLGKKTAHHLYRSSR